MQRATISTPPDFSILPNTSFQHLAIKPHVDREYGTLELRFMSDRGYEFSLSISPGATADLKQLLNEAL